MLSVCGWYSRAATIHLPGATIRENGEGNGEEKEKIQEEEKENYQGGGRREDGVHVYKNKNGEWRGRWRRDTQNVISMLHSLSTQSSNTISPVSGWFVWLNFPREH